MEASLVYHTEPEPENKKYQRKHTYAHKHTFIAFFQDSLRKPAPER